MSRCSSSFDSFKKYKCRRGTATNIYGIGNMMSDIRNRGPVEATFSVYADLYNYRSGIY